MCMEYQNDIHSIILKWNIIVDISYIFFDIKNSTSDIKNSIFLN